MSNSVQNVIITTIIGVLLAATVITVALCIMSAQDVRHKHASEIQRNHAIQVAKIGSACIKAGNSWINGNCILSVRSTTTP